MKKIFTISFLATWVSTCMSQETLSFSGLLSSENDALSPSCINILDSRYPDFYNTVGHFNGFFFGDFNTYGRQGIHGPLAVGGNANIPSYSINKNMHGNCGNSTSDIERIGLTVNELCFQGSLYVAGDIITGNSPTYDSLVFGDTQCEIKNGSSAPFPFDSLQSDASAISKYLATLQPTHVLRGSSLEQVSGASNSNQPFYVLQFGPCAGNQCQEDGISQLISDASQIFLGGNSWTGPVGGYPGNDMVIFNIGIQQGESFVVTTDSPNAGLSPCRAVFNFYSVDAENGCFGATDVSLVREGKGIWGGVVMNVWGGIVDGPKGNFGGQLIGVNYQWQDKGNGVDILDFFQLGETCDGRHSCSSGIEPIEEAVEVFVTTLTATETTADTSYSVETTYITGTVEVTTTTYVVSISKEYIATSTATRTLTYSTTTSETSLGTLTTTRTHTVTVPVTASTSEVEDTTTETTTTEDSTVEETTTRIIVIKDLETTKSTYFYHLTDVVTEETTTDIYSTLTITDVTSIEDFDTTTTTTTAYLSAM